MSQHEIQMYHWKQPQISLFTYSIWYEGNQRHLLIDSDNLDHTKETVTIRTYISMILEEIPDEISQVTICSDGPISQFKNKYIAASLEVLKEKYHETIKWNCFAIIHGKGPEDGIGGVLGRQVWQSVLSSKDLVFTASDTATVARHVLEISVIYMTHGGIGFVNKELNIKTVFKKTKSVKGIFKARAMICKKKLSNFSS